MSLHEVLDRASVQLAAGKSQPVRQVLCRLKEGIRNGDRCLHELEYNRGYTSRQELRSRAQGGARSARTAQAQEVQLLVEGLPPTRSGVRPPMSAHLARGVRLQGAGSAAIMGEPAEHHGRAPGRPEAGAHRGRRYAETGTLRIGEARDSGPANPAPPPVAHSSCGDPSPSPIFAGPSSRRGRAAPRAGPWARRLSRARSGGAAPCFGRCSRPSPAAPAPGRASPPGRGAGSGGCSR